MFKLLTEEKKVEIEKEYKLRLIIIALWSVIAVIIIGMVSLFPSYILTKARHAEVVERLALMERTSLSAEDQEVEFWLTQINQKLKFLAPKFDDDRPAAFIEEALKVKVSGIRINSLEWKREDGKEALVLSGTSNDRQSLISFENALNKSGKFGKVSLPISNLAKDKDIDFQVKLMKEI